MLSHGHVDLGVGSNILGLLLALKNLLLGSIDVSLVDVLSLLRVVLSLNEWLAAECLYSKFIAHLLERTIRLKLDLVGQGVEFMSLVLDDLFQSLLETGTNDPQHQWLEQAKQELVLGLLELDVEVLHINVDLVDLEEILLVTFISSRHLDFEAEAGS